MNNSGLVDWRADGGEMAERIRAFDWSSTAIGAPETWSPALRMMVQFLLANRFPLLLWWGPHYVSIYNDAYRPVLGTKHPWSLGKPLSECWSEIWHVLKPLVDTPYSGGPSTWNDDIELELNRHGFLEETHFTVAYSPVPDESVPGGIGGVLATVHEITGKIISERRVVALRDLGARAIEAKTPKEACAIAAETLGRHRKDIPSVALYLIDGDGQRAVLAGTAGVEAGQEISPALLAQALRSDDIVLVEHLAAALVPIPSNKPHEPAAVMIAGISPRLKFDDFYRDFLALVKTQIATAIANARAYEEERRRAEALAEIDRAKTAFFSNVSHEFRTPLTLMLGPLEDTLARASTLAPADREQLETVHRNSLRLLKLVNTLLDFSRIEAGRVRATYEATDLAAATTELASVFRSAIEKAGLKLIVACPPLAELAYVDREMWEKIVLNLISNAFKFTFQGEIEVSLRQSGARIELIVRDTGIGIAPDELPNVFERFHRVAGARGRTHEGSGIGLALVQELAKLHGGSVAVQSVLGEGSTFTVSIALGRSHLPVEQMTASQTQSSTALGAAPFVEEALRWLPAAGNKYERNIRDSDVVAAAGSNAPRARIVLADDNADMREYVRRLLASRYEVEAVADGQAALEAIARHMPDLVLSDVMMPRLDGMQLLARLRADQQFSTVPLILLSARAGEENRVQGMQAGADDYLIKPFSARELLARVEAHLKMARYRSEVTETLRASEQRFRAFVTAISDVVYRMSPDWKEMCYLHGKDFIADTHNPSASWLATYIHPDDQAHVLATINEAIRTKSTFELEHRVIRVDGTLGWAHARAIPLLDADGEIAEWFGAARDITGRREAEQALRESEGRFRNMADHAPVMIWVTDVDGSCTYLSKSWYDFTGQTPERGLGFGWLAATHPEDRRFAHETFLAANTKHAAFRLEYRLRRHDGEYRWAFDTASPRFSETGEFLGYIGSVIDITERKQAEETQQLLIGELNHRVKNTLASVQAIVQYTMRKTKDPAEFAESFTGRIQSMARVHSLLTTTTWRGAHLSDLIHDQLLQGAVDEARITASGPPVHLQAQTTLHLALVLHELGTNANKYGALSTPSGTVAISWTVEDGSLCLRWEERGGPAMTSPAKRGFGTTLIEQSLKSERGTAKMSVGVEGILWELTLPLRAHATTDSVTSRTREPRGGEMPTSPQIEKHGRRKLAGKRLLIVEDEPLVALDIASGLEDAGAAVVASASTDEAMDVIASEIIDGALLDGNLHGRSVDDVAAALTRHKVPFLFVTGYGRESLPQAFRNVGVLTKPFAQDQLIEAAAQLLTSRSNVIRFDRPA